MAILLDSPQGARPPRLSRGPSPMAQGRSSSTPVEGSAETADKLGRVLYAPAPAVVQQQPMSGDYAHFRSASDSVSASVPSRRPDTDWLWHWPASTPRSVGETSSDLLTTEAADAQRKRSNSSPISSKITALSPKRRSFSPPPVSPSEFSWKTLD